MVVVFKEPVNLISPTTSNVETGTALPIPTLPPSLIIITTVESSTTFIISLLPCCVTIKAGPVPLLEISNCVVTSTLVSVRMNSPVKLIEPSTVKSPLIWTFSTPSVAPPGCNNISLFEGVVILLLSMVNEPTFNVLPNVDAPVTFIVPLTSSFDCGLFVPIPT